MTLTRGQLVSLARLVALTRSAEIDCEELLARVAAYAEAGRKNELAAEFDVIAQHLEICPECAEEFEVLKQLLQDPD